MLTYAAGMDDLAVVVLSVLERLILYRCDRFKKKELYKRIHGDPRGIEMYRTFNYELNKKFVDHMVINKQVIN
jgi:hypothetical protein